MTEKQAHTPTPWRSSQMGSEGSRILPDYGDIRERTKYIAIVNGRDTVTDFANAEFIVRAVNSHDALVEACRQAYEHVAELETAWARGCIRESDGLGGTRSNRNADLEILLAKTIQKAEEQP